ncbi:hypothetical protein H6F51_18130 [Cyanobacteria bacterium FACHB-DQ100]|nr:hypothetical protein [Cyanobacteria bacterium FACHB-DQ100]
MNAKTIALSIIGTLAGVITALQGTVQAQEVPRLKQGMHYSEAREILINAGWQAIEIPPLQREAGSRSWIEPALDRGYNEVVSCSGTGMGFCRFEFAAADGRKLAVVTVGGGRLILRHWQLEKSESRSSSPKPVVLRAENSSGKCTAALENARRQFETGRSVKVISTEPHDISSDYSDHPENRPVEYRFLFQGRSAHSLMESPQFLKSVATKVIQNCSSTGMVTFGVWRTGNVDSFGVFPGGKIESFQCLEPGRDTRKPNWGERYCV